MTISVALLRCKKNFAMSKELGERPSKRLDTSAFCIHLAGSECDRLENYVVTKPLILSINHIFIAR